MIDSTTLAVGTVVIYHGSLTDFHGPARFERICACPRCKGQDDERLRLVHLASEELLTCCRRHSVSLGELSNVEPQA